MMSFLSPSSNCFSWMQDLLNQVRPLTWSWLLGHGSIWYQTFQGKAHKNPFNFFGCFCGMSYSNQWLCLSHHHHGHHLPSHFSCAVPCCESSDAWCMADMLAAAVNHTSGALHQCCCSCALHFPGQNLSVSCWWEGLCTCTSLQLGAAMGISCQHKHSWRMLGMLKNKDCASGSWWLWLKTQTWIYPSPIAGRKQLVCLFVLSFSLMLLVLFSYLGWAEVAFCCCFFSFGCCL